MLISWFWSIKIVKLQKQEYYIYLQMDQLDNPLTSHPILTGWEMSIEQYKNWQLGNIDDLD